jgi:hypothetical protein
MRTSLFDIVYLMPSLDSSLDEEGWIAAPLRSRCHAELNAFPSPTKWERVRVRARRATPIHPSRGTALTPTLSRKAGEGDAL